VHTFKSIIQKFSNKGEKTGWTYVDVPPDIIPKLKLKNKKEFRIKGLIDDVKFERLACYPIGEGNFIIAINGELRKKLGKKEGAMVTLKFEKDEAAALQSQELIDCLNEDKIALKQFNAMLLSQRNYFHRYVYSAKGAATKAGRIVHIINAMHKKQDFGAMIRGLKEKNLSGSV
jgi:hypothetical protein